MLIDLKKYIEKRIFGDVIESSLINYVIDNSFQNSKLVELEELIKDDAYGSYVLERVELMKVMKFSETEIEDFLDKHYEKLMKLYKDNNMLESGHHLHINQYLISIIVLMVSYIMN